MISVFSGQLLTSKSTSKFNGRILETGRMRHYQVKSLNAFDKTRTFLQHLVFDKIRQYIVFGDTEWVKLDDAWEAPPAN